MNSRFSVPPSPGPWILGTSRTSRLSRASVLQSIRMGNENSTGQSHQRPGIWMLARKGDASALRAGIARIPDEHKASYLNWTDQFDQRTPVAMATVLNFPECVKVLLDAGADGNKIDGIGMGPLDHAVQANNVAIATLLLESDQVDCNVVDARGLTPLLSAAADGQPQVLDVLLHCERVDLFACQSKTGLNVLGIARKAYSKASSKERPRFRECLGLVEKRLLIRSGHLYEFTYSKAAKKWVWERRIYQVFQAADSRLAKIDLYAANSELPSVESLYHCTQSNQKSDISELGLNKTQASFTERDHRFTLRTNIAHKKHTVMQVFECAASSADDLAFWKSLPEDLRTSRFSALESTTSSIVSGRGEASERWQEPQEPQEPVHRPQEPQEEPANGESAEGLSDLQSLQRQSELLQQQLRQLQEDQRRLQQQEEAKRRQQELEEQQRIQRELEEQRIQREQEEQRLQQERLEQLVQERLQERLEQEREERRLEQERLELIVQERLQQEQEEQRQQQQQMEQMRIQLEEMEQREMERVMQLSLDESASHPSAPAFEGLDPEHLAAAQEAMDSKSTECLVCYDAVRDAVCVPCGHISMCMDCANEVKRSSKKCIVCRGNIRSVVKIFHA